MIYDKNLDDEIREYSLRLVNAQGERNEIMNRMEDMYFMRMDNEEQIARRLKHVKQTKSPDPRNAVRGAVNLMTVTEPQVMVPYDTAYAEQKNKSSTLEKAAKTMLAASGSVRGNPIHYDVAMTGLLFDEIHIILNKSDDIVKHAAGGSPASKARVKRIARMTPVLFDVVDPRTGYADWDSFGLRAYYREFELTVQEILDQYGEKAKEFFGSKRIGPFETRTVCDLYNLQYRQVWIKDQEGVIDQYEHGLEFIPVVVQKVNASRVLNEHVEPFLYTFSESNLWNRQNLALTVMYSRLYSMLTPGWIEEQKDNQEVKFNFDPILPRIQVPEGSKLYQVEDRGGMSPALEYAYKLAEQKGGESMIYPQALGQPMGGSVAYSTVALLNQAGRLPLVQVQQKGSFAIGEALRLAFLWMKGKKISTAYKSQSIEIMPDDIPDPLEIEVRLEVHMPQDMLGKSNIVGMLVDRGVSSMRWLRDEVLDMQSDDMDYEIMTEKAQMHFFSEYMANVAKVMQQAQAMQAGGGQAPPGMAGVPGGAGEGMPSGAPAGMIPGGGEMPIAPGAEVGGPGGLPAMMLMNGGQGPEEVR